MRDLHTTETTGHERFPSYSGHGTNYFRFVLTFSFFTSKQLVFLPICFTVCAIIAKNIGLSDFEINYKADLPGETPATVQSYCITIENTRGNVSKISSVLRIIDRLDRNPPITAR